MNTPDPAPGAAPEPLSPRQLRAVFDSSACGLVVQDGSGLIVDCNAAAERLLGLTRDQLMGLTSVDPHWRAIAEDGTELPGDQHPAMRTLRTGVPVHQFEMGVRLPDDTRRWISVSTSLLPAEGALAPGVLASFFDTTARRTGELALAEQWQRLRSTLQGARTAIWGWNVQTDQLRWDTGSDHGPDEDRHDPANPPRAATPAAAGAQDAWTARVHPDDVASCAVHLQSHLAGRLDRCDIECRMRHRDGSWRWVRLRGRVTHSTADGRPLWMHGTHEDITTRKALELELQTAATQDRLTGLPNRATLTQSLEALAQQAREQASAVFAVLFLDFDRFKLVNDTLGHAAGDELLRAVADRLRTALPAPCPGHAPWQLARFGGDEFVLLAPGLCDAGEAQALGRRLLALLEQPYAVRGKPIRSSASIGVAFSEGVDTLGESLLRDADTAMYEAKRAGRGTLVVFDAAMRERLTRTVQIEAGLPQAAALGQLTVLYQPIVDLDTGLLCSAEALLRWQHPELGAVSPAEFIPIAEESGHILALGEWVLRQACRQWVRWQEQDAAAAPATVSVNLSRVQLAQGERLLATVSSALADAGMPPAALQLEITEREVTREAHDARAQMQALRAWGVKLAMDDFGTGASSLGCLRDYPFHTIKIDKSFVTDLCRDPNVLAVAHATVNVIENLGMLSVAEGIEEPDELATLQSLGCRYGQGWLFGRPMAGERLLAHMAQAAGAPPR